MDLLNSLRYWVHTSISMLSNVFALAGYEYTGCQTSFRLLSYQKEPNGSAFVSFAWFTELLRYFVWGEALPGPEIVCLRFRLLEPQNGRHVFGYGSPSSVPITWYMCRKAYMVAMEEYKQISLHEIFASIDELCELVFRFSESETSCCFQLSRRNIWIPSPYQELFYAWICVWKLVVLHVVSWSYCRCCLLQIGAIPWPSTMISHLLTYKHCYIIIDIWEFIRSPYRKDTKTKARIFPQSILFS